MMRLVTSALLLFFFAACQSSESSNIETVEVKLNEYGYETSRDTFRVGQPYRFNLVNNGDIAHEWVIVPRGINDEEAGIIEVMENQLPPGSQKTISYTFLRPGSYDFACFLPGPPGHYKSGMVHPIEVLPRDAKES